MYFCWVNIAFQVCRAFIVFILRNKQLVPILSKPVSTVCFYCSTGVIEDHGGKRLETEVVPEVHNHIAEHGIKVFAVTAEDHVVVRCRLDLDVCRQVLKRYALDRACLAQRSLDLTLSNGQLARRNLDLTLGYGGLARGELGRRHATCRGEECRRLSAQPKALNRPLFYFVFADALLVQMNGTSKFEAVLFNCTSVNVLLVQMNCTSKFKAPYIIRSLSTFR